jgi:VWFA-related protein
MPLHFNCHSLLLLAVHSAMAALLAVACAPPALAQSGRRISKPPTRAQEDKSEVVTIRTTEVSLRITVRDSLGRAVDGLKADDFFIYDNGRRYEPLRFERLQSPVNLVLLLDEADGFFQDAEVVRRALLSFRQALNPADRVAVMRFTDEIMLRQDWTDDEATLARALKRGRQGGAKAAIYDALILAAVKLNEVEGRRAIVLLTNGLNTAGVSGAGAALAAAQGVEAPVYVFSQTEAMASAIRQRQSKKSAPPVLIADTSPGAMDDAPLRLLEAAERELTALAEQSGGMIYFPLRESSLSWMLAQVAGELRAQYLVTYQPATDGDWAAEAHRIEVLVRGGHQARPGYARRKTDFSGRLLGAVARPLTW